MSITSTRSNVSKKYFPLPNEIFILGLCPGELAVYAFLMYCEDRTTFKCWPSYKTIGKAVGMTQNTVRKYVQMLVERGLISVESTVICTRDGRTRNGSLLYTIHPIKEVMDSFYQRQLDALDESAVKQRTAKALAESPAVGPCEPLCDDLEEGTGSCLPAPQTPDLAQVSGDFTGNEKEAG